MSGFNISTESKYATFQDLSGAMIRNKEKYDFDSTKLHALKPRYNDIMDGLEKDTKMYLDVENKFFHATIITMTTLLIASIVISSSR